MITIVHRTAGLGFIDTVEEIKHFKGTASALMMCHSV